jgi:phage terminase large subunit GpA-like protein
MVVMKSSESAILKARVDLDPQTVPGKAIALTCGIDPQKVGFWFTVRAWERNFNSWLIHYGFLPTWDDVENLLFKTEYPQDGSEKKYRIWRAAIDTGGGKFNDKEPSMTEEAYWFVRLNGVGRGCQVWATKGSSRPLAGKMAKGKLIDQVPSGASLEGGVQLMLIDTSQMKDTIYYRLGNAVEKDPMAAYLHREVKKDYAKQILAEEKQLDEKGQQVWVQVGTDNHYLDTECLAHACADPEWIGGGVNILSAALDIEKRKREAIVRAKKKRDVKGIKKSYSRPDWLDR